MKSKCVLVSLAGLFAATALADGSNLVESSVSDISVFNTSNPVSGVAVAIREPDTVTAYVSITELNPGDAYSIWWVIFNRPRFCSDACGLDDLPPTGDPRVEASLLWGGGFVAGANGSANVTSEQRRGHPPGEVRFGPGLKRLRDAEIHIVLRTHGPAIPGMIAEQTGSFGGGCGPAPTFAGCGNRFASVHFSADNN